MPKPVLGGATLIMFGTVAIAGIKILAEAGLHRRNMLIVSISLGMGLGVASVPEVLSAMPDVLKNIFGSPITIGAFSAILLNLFLPREASERDVFDPEELIEDAVGTNTLSVNIPDYREQDDRHRRDALPQPAGADFKG
jgi:xanthine permease XanP